MYIEFREDAIFLKECRYDKAIKRGKTITTYLASNTDQAILKLQEICKKDDIECRKLVKEIEKKQNEYAVKKAIKLLNNLYEKLPENAKITKDILKIINKYDRKEKDKAEHENPKKES